MECPNSKKNINVCRTFLIYWLALILWQNLFKAETRGGIDAIFKVFLLGFLIVSFLQRKLFINRNNIIVLALFGFSQMITLFLCDIQYQSIGVVVSYLYPIVYIFLVYCIGNNLTATKKQVDKMNNYILIVLLISIFYTLIFDPKQYTKAIQEQDSGYGSELSSFFLSMHEYALYLFYGITVCVNRITEKKKGYFVYYLLFFTFFATMVFTFSRTALVGCLVYLCIYALLNRKSNFSKVFVVLVCVAFLVILTTPAISDYVYKVVWKSGHMSSREKLNELAGIYFEEGTILNKFFGHGITSVNTFFVNEGDIQSVHNAYLHVLLCYGITGIAFFVAYLIVQVVNILRFFKYDKAVALSSFGMLVFSILVMIPNTFLIFSSSIDCFFITSMMLVIPKYQRNAVRQQIYYK